MRKPRAQRLPEQLPCPAACSALHSHGHSMSGGAERLLPRSILVIHLADQRGENHPGPSRHVEEILVRGHLFAQGHCFLAEEGSLPARCVKLGPRFWKKSVVYPSARLRLLVCVPSKGAPTGTREAW